MQLTEGQSERLKKLSASCGKDLLFFFNLMVQHISDIRTDLKVEANLDKDVRLAVISLLTDFTEKIKGFSGRLEEKGEDRFD